MQNTVPGEQKALYETELTGIYLKQQQQNPKRNPKRIFSQLLLDCLGRLGLLPNLCCPGQARPGGQHQCLDKHDGSHFQLHASDLTWLAVSIYMAAFLEVCSRHPTAVLCGCDSSQDLFFCLAPALPESHLGTRKHSLFFLPKPPLLPDPSFLCDLRCQTSSRLLVRV